MEPIPVALQHPRVRRWGVALLTVLLTLPAMWPFLSHEGYWFSHDGRFHLYRLLSLQEAWGQGHFYPRIFPDFAFGYGFAVLNFYGPLTYYVALAIGGLGLPAIAAMKLTFALSYPLAALAVWWFARDLWRADDAPNDIAGLAAAIVYTYVPYHMADVQLRGALAESWAFVWWPLLFRAAWRGCRWPFALSLAALILTHNLSVVLVAFPLAFWALLASFREKADEAGPTRSRNRHALTRLLKLGIGAGVALLLTLFYWLPVVLESRYVLLSQDVGGLGFANHLAPLREWLARSATYHYSPFQGVQADHPLSWAQAALLALSLLVLSSFIFRWRRWRIPVLFWGATFFATLFVLTPTSFALWQRLVFPFGLMQYPWRWLGITALATAMIVSAAFGALYRPLQALRPSLQRGLLLSMLLLLLWLTHSSLQHLRWEPLEVEPELHPAAMWERDVADGQVGATWTAEFLPRGVPEQRWLIGRAPETVADVGEHTPLRVTEAWSDGFRLSAEVQSDAPGWLTFPRFAYGSMRATVDGEPRPLEPRGSLGLAAIEVPSGTHHVVLEAYPLAANSQLGTFLWLPPLALVLYGLFRLGRRGLVIGAATALVVLALLVTREPAILSTPAQAQAGTPLQFGEQAQLVSMRLNEDVLRAGAPLKVTLLWFNLVQTDQRYSTFVHLTPPGGGIPVAQHDSEPNMGTIPTSRWLPGQLVEDLHLLVLPDDLPSGEYELWGGLYSAMSGTAAPVPGDSGERRLLGTVQVR
jgi:hypothetical protein